jgi:hypothetical protein
MEARRFFLDTASRAFVDGVAANLTPAAPVFFGEDVEAIELYFLKSGKFLDYSANTVKLAVGLTAPAALQTSWSAVSTSVTATITATQNGGSGVDEIQTLTFSKAPIAGSFALQLPSRNVTVSSVSAGLFTCAAAHGLVNGQSVTLTGFSSVTNFANGNTLFVRERTPLTFKVAATTTATTAISAGASSGGTAQVAALTTPQIASSGDATNVQAALTSAIGSVGIVVTGSYADGFVLTFTNDYAGINFANLVVVNNTLQAAPGLAANLSFNTNEVQSLISAGNTSNLRMELEVSNGTLRQTYATGASISSDIISSTSAAPLPTITPATSFNLISPDTAVWNVTIDDSGVLTVAKT